LNDLPGGPCGVLAAIFLIVLTLSGCDPAGGGAVADPGSPKVVVERVSASSARPVAAMGTIGFRFEISLSFKTGGIVDTINNDLGDAVKRGQVVATLKPTETSARLSAALANVTVNERSADRLQKLRASGAVSDADREKAEYDYKNALATAQIARFDSQSAAILAPTDGVVLRRVADPNQVVAAGEAVLVIGDQDSGKVARADFAARDVQYLKPGDSADIAPTDGGAAVTGTVARISPKADATSGGFTVEVALPPNTRLLAGDTAEVRLTSADMAGGTRMLQIPPLALLDARGNQGMVYVVDAHDVAHRRAVRIADITDGGVGVMDGLAAGERLIVSGGAYVREGSRVQVSTAR
jgi:RND family efflux transporter MFP subunit